MRPAFRQPPSAFERGQARSVYPADEHRIPRRHPLLEKLGDEDVMAPLLEHGRTIEHDGELDQAREEMAGQGETTDRGVLVPGAVRVKQELRRRRRR